MAKGSREVRLNTLKDWFEMKEAGMLTSEQVKTFVEKTGHRVYESELEKFNQLFPAIDADAFKAFLIEVQALKRAGKKAPVGSGTGAQHAIKMNTAEKAIQVGVSEADFPEYELLIETIYTAKAKLAKLCTNGVVSFAIPVKKEKLVKETPTE